VAGIVEDVKLTGAPAPRQLPRGIQRAADVVAAVDQDAGNAVQGRGITQQLILPEEGGVAPECVTRRANRRRNSGSS
jgi:hypothetical protein